MERSMDADQVIKDLMAGNKRFLGGESIQTSESSLKKLKDFSEKGQFPKAIVLCCSDSRAPVEMIFDQDIGDLFVIRVAGNIIAPSLIGSVEFAVSAFGTNLILVMGHTQCGAIRVTLEHIENSNAIPSENIHDIVSRIKPHIFPITQMKEITHEEKFTRSIEANVFASVDQLSHSSRLIEGLLSQGKIKIRGAILNLSTGYVDFLEI
jgi:carbonic anhydrase